MKPHFAVVGASIAGSICALMLRRLGFPITVFEKISQKEQVIDRGAGMWLPNALINTLIEQQYLPKDFPSLPVNTRPIYVYDASQNQAHLLSEHPLSDPRSVHWMNLYQALRQAQTKNSIHYGSEVTDIIEHSTQVELVINQKEHHTFDGVIFADGVHSKGRRYVYPNVQPQFANSIIWRGTVDVVDKKTEAALSHKANFYVCERGHLLIYIIPHETNPEAVKLNWLFYEKVDAQHPRQNVAKGTMSKEHRDYLHAAAKQYFPPIARDIILNTAEPFIQAMHDLLIPSYVKNRIALLGDASILVRPHAAVGATKAIQDVLALGTQLQKQPDVSAALQAWNQERQPFGAQQYQLGQILGDLFVMNCPRWEKLTQAEMDKIWYDLIREHHCWYAEEEK